MPHPHLPADVIVPLPQPGADPFQVLHDEMEGLGHPGAGALAARVLDEVHAWLAEGGARAWDEPPADLDPLLPVADALRLVFHTVRLPAPQAREVAELSLACFALAAFCHEQRRPASALLFMDAAVRVVPESPVMVYHHGRLLRVPGVPPEHAAGRLEHAVALAEARRDRKTLGMALRDLAAMRAEAGDAGEALRLYALSARAARLPRLRLLAGDAHYASALLRLERRELAKAATQAARAVEAYGMGHPRVVALAVDCAWELLDRFGDPESAMRLLNELEGHAHPPARDLLLQGMRVRCAASLDWEKQYETDAILFDEARTRAPTGAGEAAALVQAARAAVCFGMYARAEVAAESAVRIARKRGEARWVAEAEAILEVARSDTLTDEELARVIPEAAYGDAPEPTKAAVRLVDVLLDGLRPLGDAVPASVVGRMLAA